MTYFYQSMVLNLRIIINIVLRDYLVHCRSSHLDNWKKWKATDVFTQQTFSVLHNSNSYFTNSYNLQSHQKLSLIHVIFQNHCHCQCQLLSSVSHTPSSSPATLTGTITKFDDSNSNFIFYFMSSKINKVELHPIFLLLSLLSTFYFLPEEL